MKARKFESSPIAQNAERRTHLLFWHTVECIGGTQVRVLENSFVTFENLQQELIVRVNTFR